MAGGNNVVRTVAAAAAVVLFIGAVAGWFLTLGSYREKVNSLEAQIVMIRQRCQNVETWQQNWPSQGELMLDRYQNTKIEELLRRIDLLEQRPVKIE